MIHIGIAKSLLEQETEPLRFERFCCDLVSGIEGDARILTTSSNYDRGRDGVSVGGVLNVVLLCSLTDKIEDKALADAKKLAKGLGANRPDAIYFCSSQSFTEDRGEKISATMRTALPLPTGYDRVIVLSGLKICQLGARHPALFERHYPSELADIRAGLAESPATQEAEHALRLALSTTAAEDAATIREDVWAALLRLHLSRGDLTAAALSTAISNYLRLSAAISTPVLLAHLNALIEIGQIEVRNGVYALTAAGGLAFQEDEARVAKSVLKGKDALISATKRHLKTDITPDQENKLWHAVQEKLATLFYERGREVLAQISVLLSATGKDEDIDKVGDEVGDLDDGFEIVAALAKAAGSAFDYAEQREEVETSIRDIIVAGDDDAVRWLTRAAYAFVCACAMGIEARTRSALEEMIGGTSLIFDTDVVLTYLSPDEPAHEAVTAIRERWRTLGGRILLAEEVATEVAYHAWIAQTDSDHITPQMLGTRIDRQILSKNAFVRGFASLIEKKQAKPSHWKAWLAQFRGKNPQDTSTTKRTLTKDHNFGVLPPPSGRYRTLANKVQTFLQKSNEPRERSSASDEHDNYVRRDKAKRDATLFASTVQIRERADEGDSNSPTFLLTSSSRFAKIEREFLNDQDSFVLAVPAVLYLLSMAPDRSLGLTALRGFLFDERWQERVSDFDLMALRLVKMSKEFDIPWARRHTLLRRLHDRARKVAIDRSKDAARHSKVTGREVTREWTTPSGKQQMLQELAATLDDVAADHRAESELAEARAEIADLKRQLAARVPNRS